MAEHAYKKNTRCAQIYADDFAALSARRARTGVPMVKQLHSAIMAFCSKDEETTEEKSEAIIHDA